MTGTSASPTSAAQLELEGTLQELDIHGFAVVRGVIPTDQAAALGSTLDRLDATQGTDYDHAGAPARHVANLCSLDRAFLNLIDHPTVTSLAHAVLGEEVILGSFNARILRPGDTVQPFHSDIPSTLRRDGNPVMLQFAWLLDDASETNGATRLVPGSHLHRRSEPPFGFEPSHIASAVGPAGSLLVFNGQCWHGGGHNSSGGRRRVAFAHYRTSAWMRFQCDPHLTFPIDWVADLTGEQRKLLRMEDGLGAPTGSDYGTC